MAQITTRLSTRNRIRFEAYALKIGLDSSELARLLIIRELKIRALRDVDLERQTAPVTAGRKLTAHFHSDKIIKRFDGHRRQRGFSRAAAAKLIFERELQERWLLGAISSKATRMD